MSRKAARGAEDAPPALQHDDLELASAHEELDVAADAGRASGGHARFQLRGDLGDQLFWKSGVPNHLVGQLAQHLVEADALGEMQREREVACGHGARFYSESRP